MLVVEQDKFRKSIFLEAQIQALLQAIRATKNVDSIADNGEEND